MREENDLDVGGVDKYNQGGLNPSFQLPHNPFSLYQKKKKGTLFKYKLYFSFDESLWLVLGIKLN